MASVSILLANISRPNPTSWQWGWAVICAGGNRVHCVTLLRQEMLGEGKNWHAYYLCIDPAYNLPFISSHCDPGAALSRHFSLVGWLTVRLCPAQVYQKESALFLVMTARFIK